MDSKGIKKRLDTLQKIVDRNRVLYMKITFSDGSTKITDFDGAISVMRDEEQFADVVDVEAERPEGKEPAALLAALCRPTRDI